MASTHFKCPYCQKVVQKTAAEEVYSSTMSDGGRGAFVGSSGSRSCPYCSKQINLLNIVQGTYDVKPASAVGCLIVVGIIIVLYLLALVLG